MKFDRAALAYLRKKGHLGDMAERRQGPITRDYLGCFDIVSLDERGRPWGVQVTSKAHRADRLRKIAENANTGLWLDRGAGILLLLFVNGEVCEEVEITRDMLSM